MPNLAALLHDTSLRFPDRPALVDGDRRLTYREVEQEASRVAHVLAGHGVGPGERVVLLCPNSAEFAIAYYGILKTGATVVPLNTQLKPREIAYHLRDSQPVAVLAHVGTELLDIAASAAEAVATTDARLTLFVISDGVELPEELRHLPTLEAARARKSAVHPPREVDDEDTAVILYTSGTTGQPKGAELRHRNMSSNALVGGQVFGTSVDAPDTYLCALPLFHSFGQTVLMNQAFATGGLVILMRRFAPEPALRLIVEEDVTFFSGVPTMFSALLDAVDNASELGLDGRLRIANSGGAALPTQVHRDFMNVFGVAIAEGYGLSETSPVTSFLPLGATPRPGSIGKSIPGVEMRLIDDEWNELSGDVVGEIAVRGANVMKGYFQRPEATNEAMRDGWFRTGDLARRDEDDYYYIVDRAKDVIIRGGFNVYPREVEDVLSTHPAVAQAAVIGVPHSTLSEEVKAWIVLRPEQTVTADELVGWARDQMAHYKYPRIVEFCPELPTTSTGKLLKRQLS